jgi:hypothetical protein
MEEDKIDLTQASTDDHADLIQGVREKNAKRTLDTVKEGYTYDPPKTYRSDIGEEDPAPTDITGDRVKQAEDTLRSPLDKWSELPEGVSPEDVPEQIETVNQPETKAPPVKNYYGMSMEEIKKSIKDMSADELIADYKANPRKYQIQNRVEDGMRAGEYPIPGLEYVVGAGLGWFDFGVDFLKTLTGNEKLDTQWERISRTDHEGANAVRRFSAVALPTMIGVGKWSGAVNASKLPWLTKAALNVGGAAAIDAAVISISDEGFEHNAMGNLRKGFPETFGPQGRFPISEDIATLDSDSPEIRKHKNRLESTIFSGVADILAFTVGRGKPILNWFVPKSKRAKAFKSKEAIKHADPDSVIRIAKIDESMSTGALTAPEIKVLKQEREEIVEQLNKTGTSKATRNPAETSIRRSAMTRDKQTDDIALTKLKEKGYKAGDKLDSFDADISPNLAPDGSTARQSIPPGNVARNMADTAAIKKSLTTGDPAPILSDPMIKKGLKVGKSRNAVLGVAESAREAGDFDAIVDGFRVSKRDMEDSAWKIYKSIMRPTAVDDLKKAFFAKRDLKHLADGTKVRYATEEQAQAAAYALSDLVNVYLGRDITESSARVMDTLGREISTIADTTQTYKEFIDNDRVTEMVLDKMEFLMAEYGLNKYISGWQLQNKKWWQTWWKTKDPDAVMRMTKEQFDQVQNAKHKEFKEFRTRLEGLKETNPEALRPLMTAFTESNGNVDTLAKLYKWANDQVSWKGLIVSPNPTEMNLFARGAWGVVYNNVLSGLAPLNALKGNGFKMMFQPIEHLLGSSLEALKTGSYEPIKRSLYYNSVNWETQQRALSHAAQRLRKVHSDPEFMMKAVRKDYLIKQDKKWDLLDQMVPLWEKNKDHGNLFQYGWAKNNHDISKMKWMRSGMTGMSGVDAYTDVLNATKLSRVKAYDEIFTKHGDTLDPEVFSNLLTKAEQKNYSNMFDKDGLLTDQAAKTASGEVNLNLDDGVSNWINTATTAVPGLKNFFLFPRTGINFFKLASSYTPLANIPGITKYGRVLNAGNDMTKIRAALAEHGVKNFDDTPNAMAIFENLKTEYRGRLALSYSTTLGMFGYAMAGNIRGNGPQNGSERSKLRMKGWRPKTIKIGNKWVSYDGIPMLDTVLTVVGDLGLYANDIGSSITEDIVQKLAWTVSATYLNNTPLYGIEPFLAAANGDETAWNRIGANLVRGAIPMSGSLGVVSRAISDSQKDIHNDLKGYVANNLPIASSLLPEQRDYWTGQPINHIDNPFLRMLNAVNPIKMTQVEEPWRRWLIETGFDGPGLLRKTYNGTREYTGEERDLIGQYMGEDQLWKQVESFRKSKRFNEELDILRDLRRRGATYKDIKIQAEKLPVYQRLTEIVRASQLKAEVKLQDKYPQIWEANRAQKIVDSITETGLVGEANDAASQLQQQLNKLQKIRK